MKSQCKQLDRFMRLRVVRGGGKAATIKWSGMYSFCRIPLYLQSVPVHSANVVKSCTKACRRVLTGTLIYLIGSESSCDLGNVTYKLSLKNYIYNYNIYLLNLVGRSIWQVSSQSPCFWRILKV
jgi:hypothetical protein